MPVPKKRLLIHKESGSTTEAVTGKKKKDVIFGYNKKSAGVLRFLRKRREKRLTQAQRDIKMRRPMKHLKPAGSFWRFHRVETLVKRQRTNMKHHKRTVGRKANGKALQCLRRKVARSPLLLVVRIHGHKNLPKAVAMLLKNKWCLLRVGHAAVVRNSPQVMRELVTLAPYVTFGEATRQCVRDLVLKRGRIVDPKSGERATLNSNVLVEERLGAYGLICVEDVVEVLATSPYKLLQSESGKNKNKSDDSADFFVNESLEKKCDSSKLKTFDAVAEAINPFVLNSKKFPMRGLKAPFDHRGYWGYRGIRVNEFVQRFI